MMKVDLLGYLIIFNILSALNPVIKTKIALQLNNFRNLVKLELIIINQYIYQVRCLTARLSAQKPNRFVKQFCYPSPFFIYFALFWLLITRFVVQLINHYIFFYIR